MLLLDAFGRLLQQYYSLTSVFFSTAVELWKVHNRIAKVQDLY